MSSKGPKRLSLKRKSVGDEDHSSRKCQMTKGFCPLCQMPLDILTCQTETWHYEECFSINRTGQKECPKGTACDSTIVSHYLKETHLRLAAQRCNLQPAYPESEVRRTTTIDAAGPEAIAAPLPSVHEGISCDLSPRTGAGSPVFFTKLDADRSCKTDTVPLSNGTRDQLESPKKNVTKSQAKITSFFQNSGLKVPKPIASIPSKKSTSSVAAAGRQKSLVASNPPTNSTSSGPAPGRQNPPKTITLPDNPSSTFQAPASWRGDSGGRAPRRCPFYKKLVDVPFVVDAFSYGVIPGILAYFLSHFHSDHYMGLNSKFSQPLFCSQVTANLVKLRLRVSESVIHPLPMDKPHVVRGVEVTLIEANHCPGAVMFLFRYTDGRCILHTGDFRADPTMEDHPALASVSLDVLYLDTTYCKQNYDFPSQQEVLAFIMQAAKKHLKWHASTLIVCGAYTIGKEKVFLALANALQRRVWASREKLRIFQCLEDPALQAVLCADQNLAGIHVLGMQQLNFKHLQDYLDQFGSSYSSLLAIKPTGWEHGSRRNVSNHLEGITPVARGNIAIYGVPYSEHSSYGEMRRFVQSLRPARVIPTVNVAGPGAKQQMEVIRGWLQRQK